MKIVVVTNDDLKEELLEQGLKGSAEIEWLNDIHTIPVDADAYIDLLFDRDRNKRKEILGKLNADIIIINDVIEITENLPRNFVRINGWPTFLKRRIAEASSNNEHIKSKAEEVLDFF